MAHWNNQNMTTFNDWPRWDGRSKCDIAIVGAPFDMGAGARGGQRDAPFAIRTASYWGDYHLHHVETGAELGNELTIVDAGNSEVPIGSLDEVLTLLRNKVSRLSKKADAVITLGGDHSVSFATIGALTDRHGPLTIVHFDTHADIWPSTTKFPMNHGNWMRNVIDQDQHIEVVQLGLHGYGPEKKDFKWAEKRRVTWVSAKHLMSIGPEAWCAHFAKHNGNPIHLSVDLDVCDPAYAPGVSTPEPGGLTSRDLLDSVRTMVTLGNVVGIDIVELCPSHDPAGITALLANRLVTEFCIGKVLRRG